MLDDNHSVVMRVLRPDTTLFAAERIGRTYILTFGRDPNFPDLFRTIIYRGGEENRPTIHTQIYDDKQIMLKDVRDNIRLRFNHGYSLIWHSPNLPLLAWIMRRGYTIEFEPNYAPPGIQLHLPMVVEYF